MLDLTIDLVLWKATESDTSLAMKIGSSISSNVVESTINPPVIRVSNVSAMEYSEPTTKHSIVIVFGDLARGMLSAQENIYLLPEISRLHAHPKNTESRRQAAEITKIICAKIKEMCLEKSVENKQTEHVETDTGIKVGRSGFDINITEQEAEYLKKIRDLLGGGKIVITKGDLKIEVEK